MSDQRWVSAAIVFHLVAITLAALPPPAEIGSIEPSGSPDSAGVLPATIDRLASTVATSEGWLYTLATPLRLITKPYVDAGLLQKWNMFASPDVNDTYLRVDYFVATRGSRVATERVQELVFPADPEDEPRWRHEFRDKAIFNSIENYFIAQQRLAESGELSETPADMVPIARYFGNRFAASLDDSHALIRVEIWVRSGSKSGSRSRGRPSGIEVAPRGLGKVSNAYSRRRRLGQLAWRIEP